MTPMIINVNKTSLRNLGSKISPPEEERKSEDCPHWNKSI